MWPATAVRKLNCVSQHRSLSAEWLEVVGNVVGEVSQECGPEQQADVDGRRDAHFGAGGPGRLQRRLDDTQVGALSAAEVGVPLILLEIGEDRVLWVGHIAIS